MNGSSAAGVKAGGRWCRRADRPPPRLGDGAQEVVHGDPLVVPLGQLLGSRSKVLIPGTAASGCSPSQLTTCCGSAGTRRAAGRRSGFRRCGCRRPAACVDRRRCGGGGGRSLPGRSTAGFSGCRVADDEGVPGVGTSSGPTAPGPLPYTESRLSCGWRRFSRSWRTLSGCIGSSGSSTMLTLVLRSVLAVRSWSTNWPQ